LAPAFWPWSQMRSQLVPIDASLLDHARPSRRLARSLWIGVITCVQRLAIAVVDQPRTLMIVRS